MDLSDRRMLVTGGGGFVGSHLTERLLDRGNDVTVVDSFSTGRRDWIDDRAHVITTDLSEPDAADSVIDGQYDAIWHLASRSDPNDEDPRRQFTENTTMTHNVLAAARDAGVTNLVYTSSSTVYGEAPRPTPEDYAPLEPISVYGASKLADEGLLSTYAHSHDRSVWCFRFANVVGPRLRGAVIPDFIEKLRGTSSQLEILGDGRQEKSYLHVTDCIDGMVHAVEAAQDGPFHCYNLGTRTTTSVDRVADIVSDVLDLDPAYEYTGGDRGWTGDVPRMRLSIEKLSALGWSPQLESDKAVRQAATELADEI